MAKSIMGDAQVNKIVTDSQQRVAKARKKGKKAALIAPLVIGADQVLKVRAQQRAKDFWTGQQPELQKMEDYFNTSFQFQKDHTARFSNRADWETQWKSDYHKQWIDDKLKNQGIGSGYTQEQLMTIASKDMDDDLTEYKRLLDLSADFKLSGDQTVESKKARYFEPFNTATAKHMKEMVRDGGLLPSAINFIMGKKKWNTGSPEDAAIQSFKDQVFASSLAWDEQQGKYETAIGNNRLQGIFSNTGDGGIDNFSGMLDKYKDVATKFIANDQQMPYIKGSNGNPALVQISYKLPGKTEVEKADPYVITGLMSEQDRFSYWQDVTIVASALQDQYEKTKGAGGVVGDRFVFVQEAVDIISKESVDGIDNLNILNTGKWSGFQNNGVTYTGLTNERRRDLTLGKIDSGGLYEVTSEGQQKMFDTNRQSINRAMSNVEVKNPYTDNTTGVPVDLQRIESVLLKSVDNKEIMTLDQIKSAEVMISSMPPSSQRDNTYKALATAIEYKESQEGTLKEMESSFDSSGESVAMGGGLKGREAVKSTIKETGFNSIEDAMADMPNVNIPGMMKTLNKKIVGLGKTISEKLPSTADVMKGDAPYRIPEGEGKSLGENLKVLKDTVKQDLKYFGPVNIKDAQEYVKETVPVVKKAAEQFIKDAPSKVKKAAKVVSDEANEWLNWTAGLNKTASDYITSGELGIDLGFAKDEAVEGAKQFGQEWITLGQNASEKVKEFYNATEDARKDIKDQAKLMTFYDDFTSTNWNVVKQDIADSYIQFANENNIDITKAVQKGTATWLSKMIEDTMPVSGRTAAQISMQRQKFKLKQDAAQRKINLFNMKQNAAQDIVDFTKDSSQNIGLLARREDSEEN